MAVVLDAGPIVAAVNEGDINHRRCVPLMTNGEDFVIPSPVLVEVDYWLVKLVGPQGWADFVQDLVSGAYRVVHPSEADLARAAELELAYADLRLGLVDASTIALAERFNVTRIATLDHRHFSVVRPRHCPHFTLLPE
jgi:predicted nucleic acid-binding protein